MVNNLAKDLLKEILMGKQREICLVKQTEILPNLVKLKHLEMVNKKAMVRLMDSNSDLC